MRMGLTFDDVLLKPRYSEVLPEEADLTTALTTNLAIKTPFLAAAMDTVTEGRLAVAMARAGGVGVIHKNLAPSDQAEQVRLVKRSETGMIDDPVTVDVGRSVGDAMALMEEHGISGLPVLEAGKVVGIVTGRDARFETEPRRPLREVMTRQVVSAPVGTSSGEAVRLMHQHRIEKLPVLAEDGTLHGMFTVRDIQLTERHPLASKDAHGRLQVAAAVGTGPAELERAGALLASGADLLVVDTAHGHSAGVIRAVRELRQRYGPKHDFAIIAGNVATGEGAGALIEAGAQAIKVGMGPGSICTTRMVTGIGVPQLTAIMDCAAVARPKGVPIIADGGVRFSGDAAKALAAGADSVMLGSLLAGTQEAPGEEIIYQGKTYKTYRGMGSLGAMRRGSRDRYFQAGVTERRKLVPEGVEGRVPARGPLADTIYQLAGGVRSCMGYLGVRTLAELRENAEFIQISGAGVRESHAHGVMVTREAPNYRFAD